MTLALPPGVAAAEALSLRTAAPELIPAAPCAEVIRICAGPITEAVSVE
jgi:hypothetical protein